MTEDQVQALISRWLDGSLPERDLQRLQVELASNESARESWLLLSRIHAELSNAGAELEMLEEIHTDHEEFRSEHRKRVARRRFASATWGGCFAAACVLLGLGFGFWSWGPLAERGGDTPAVDNPASFVAHIDSFSADCAWHVGSPGAKVCKAFRTNDTIHVTAGHLHLRYAHGTSLYLKSPAVYRFVNAFEGDVVNGYVKAVVPEEGKGFTVVTPQASVVDLGTEFGVSVNANGTTDVIVYRGEVDIDYHSRGAQDQRLQMGEAVRLDEVGTASRLMSVRGDASLSSHEPKRSRAPIITEVRDNIDRDPLMLSFYEIIHEGMREDALAYVDRIAHEYNGATAEGMPRQLIGGDYVKMFNRDKYEETICIDVNVAQPANLYILLDNRRAPPAWLLEGFVDTGDDIGLDGGPFQSTGPDWHRRGPSGVGPGESIDSRLSVWVKRVTSPGVVRLGSLIAADEHGANMYGIVATPLKDKTM